MTKVTYIPSLDDAAHKMCALLTRASPTIQRLYPNNAALQAALQAALAACATLGEETAKERDYGI